MELNSQNYYNPETNEEYWSASLVKMFLECPSRAVSYIYGEYNPGTSAALLVGGYVDAAIEGEEAFTKWCGRHPEIFKRDGSLKADYVKADEMLDRISSDPVFMEYLEGEKQTIVTGNIGGFKFKGKLDVLKPGERIVDLKTVRDLKPVYKPGQGRLDFATAWNWPLQMAIYQRLEGHRLPCYLAVVTKEDPPQLELVEVEQARMDAEIDFLLSKLPLWDAMKAGIVEPDRCEDCAHCRATKKITGPKLLGVYEEE